MQQLKVRQAAGGRGTPCAVPPEPGWDCCRTSCAAVGPRAAALQGFSPWQKEDNLV